MTQKTEMRIGASLAICMIMAGAQADPVPTVRLAFIGDLMMGSTWPRPDRPVEPEALWGEAADVLRQADAAFGNLEGALTDRGTSTKATGCKACYAFRLPPSDAHVLAAVGLTAVSLANNHAGDFGAEALKQAPGLLADAGIRADGLADTPPTVWDQHGQRMALLAFAPNRGVRDVLDLREASRLIRQARGQGALVVVSMHAGGEGVARRRVHRGPEHYLGENRGDVVAFAHAAIDAGAAIVFGHGPHVPRGLEVYRGHLIAYSLGNGVTHGGLSRRGATALTPVLEADLRSDTGQLVGFRVHSFRQDGRGALVRDGTQAAARDMAELSALDFPASGPCWTGIDQGVDRATGVCGHGLAGAR